MNIYVSNLGFSVQDADLQELFSGYGTVTSAKVITDRMTNQSRGFAFVEMPNDSEATAAIEALNGSDKDGRSMNVAEARPKTDRPASNRW
ncbi:MAG: RNA-binding protein [Ferruginibacter sp.]